MNDEQKKLKTRKQLNIQEIKMKATLKKIETTTEPNKICEGREEKKLKRRQKY